MSDIVERLGNSATLMRNYGERVAASELAEAAAEIERLREALRPFAVTDAAWDGQPDELEIELRGSDSVPQPCVSLGDIRRARAALARKEDKR